MPEQEPDSAALNALYEALDNWAYHVTVETTVFLDFEERATVGLSFGTHIDHDSIRLRSDGTRKVDLGSACLSVYPPGATDEATVSFRKQGGAVHHATDVRLRKAVKYR